MKILDLVNPGKSEIKYKISRFPDGQQSVTLVVDDTLQRYIIEKPEIKIISRMNSWKDIELIISAKSGLKELEFENIHLYVPYFLGARSDRKFSIGGSNYLKDVIAPVFNSQKFKTVTVLDPHSHILEATLKNFRKIDNSSLVLFAIEQITTDLSSVYLVSPDKGASDKVLEISKKLAIKNPTIEGIKHRNNEGEITHTSVQGMPNDEKSLNFIIPDDICDGGRTFVELVKVMIQERPLEKYNDKYYLIITHGIFSAGFNTLSQYFEKIFCTNSIKDIPESQVETVEENQNPVEKLIKTKTVQYDVF